MTINTTDVSINDWTEENQERYLANAFVVRKLARCPRCDAHRDEPCHHVQTSRMVHEERKAEARSILKAHVERLRRIEQERAEKHARLMKAVRLLDSLGIGLAASGPTAWAFVQRAMEDGDLVEPGDFTEAEVAAAQRFRVRTF